MPNPVTASSRSAPAPATTPLCSPTDSVTENNVTSIEIDPQVAEHARQALATAGDAATVVLADGAEGYPPHAPLGWYASGGRRESIGPPARICGFGGG